MSKKNIYEIETDSYMILDKKPSYLGKDISFYNASSKKEAGEIFKKRYAKGELVDHYSGKKKKVIYDLKNLKITEKKEYNKLMQK